MFCHPLPKTTKPSHTILFFCKLYRYEEFREFFIFCYFYIDFTQYCSLALSSLSYKYMMLIWHRVVCTLQCLINFVKYLLSYYKPLQELIFTHLIWVILISCCISLRHFCTTICVRLES